MLPGYHPLQVMHLRHARETSAMLPGYHPLQVMHLRHAGEITASAAARRAGDILSTKPAHLGAELASDYCPLSRRCALVRAALALHGSRPLEARVEIAAEIEVAERLVAPGRASMEWAAPAWAVAAAAGEGGERLGAKAATVRILTPLLTAAAEAEGRAQDTSMWRLELLPCVAGGGGGGGGGDGGGGGGGSGGGGGGGGGGA